MQPRPLRILVVVDHPNLRAILTVYLVELGHWVESAPDIGTALDRLHQKGLEVLLTDLWHPGTSGEEFLRELRTRGNLPPYVVAVGASVQPDVLPLSRAAGCCAHLATPVEPAELERAIEMVRTTMAASRTAPQRVDVSRAESEIDVELRAETIRLLTESRLLRAIVARNIASCKEAVEEARKAHAASRRGISSRRVAGRGKNSPARKEETGAGAEEAGAAS